MLSGLTINGYLFLYYVISKFDLSLNHWLIKLITHEMLNPVFNADLYIQNVEV